MRCPWVNRAAVSYTRPARSLSNACAIAGASPAPREPSALSRVPTVAEASPPDRARTWTAEIEWRESDAEGVFRVVARPTAGRGKVTIAESARLDWPPSGPASVAALRQAVGAC